MSSLFDGLLQSLMVLSIGLVVGGAVSLCGGLALASALRLRDLRWTWSVVLLPPALLAGLVSVWLSLLAVAICVVACTCGIVWHGRDAMAGGDRGEAARGRLGVLEAVLLASERWRALRHPQPWVRRGWLEVGKDRRGWGVSIPAGGESGSHALVLGATGSGKTCGEAWIAGRLIEHGHGAIAIDPKGDELLREELWRAARAAGVPFLQWSPSGPLAYNPYAHGTHTEIADKALSGEVFTEPHYLRQAQRYIGHAVRCIRAANLDLTAASLAAHMDPERLEQTGKQLTGAPQNELREYLDTLTERHKHDLAGARDRLSILAESDVSRWLDPSQTEHAIDLARELRRGAVVYFSLEADRRPLLAQMLGGAIVGDLITVAADLQRDPVPTVVLIDEFSGIGSEQIARLFARGRSAGMSLVLATQELADLKGATVGSALRDRVLGNVEAVIAYRQNVPESAELIASVAGTRTNWIPTQRTRWALLAHIATGEGTRRRGHEHVVHPSRIKQLRTGQAVVIAPGGTQPPVVAQLHHPREAHAPSARGPVASVGSGLRRDSSVGRAHD